MNIQDAINRLSIAKNRRSELQGAIEELKIDGRRLRENQLAVACSMGVRKTVNVTIPNDIGLQVLEAELKKVEDVIDKIQPVVDASNAMLKGIFWGRDE